ncbi:MAG: DUF2431 domain-containing protein [Nanoarchaeota archaeon]|nr:DUF2431 domain-containing protein [Nanoarchaeota archaeon]
MYEPAEDSFLLQKQVKKYVKKEMKVLDLGTGSGIQAETAKEITNNVLAADINKEAVEFVKKKGIKTIQSNLFSNIKEKFDLIIFNPPYLPEDKREDKESALTTTGGKQGYEILQKFFKQAKKHLNKNGKILIIFSSLTNKDKVDQVIKENNFKLEQLGSQNLNHEILYAYLIYHQ